MLNVLETKLENGTLSDYLKELTFEDLSKIIIGIKSEIKTKTDKIIFGIVLYAHDNYQTLIQDNSKSLCK